MKTKTLFQKNLNLIFISSALLTCLIFYLAYNLGTENKTTTLSFYIQGAVNQPGVYKVNGELNIAQAINLAYGLKQNADIGSVDLAKLVNNYQTIIIPAKKAVNVSEKVITSSNYINVNEATTKDLEELPGIGAASSNKIVSNRPYTDLEDLKRSGLTSSQLDNISELITF